MDRDLTTSTSLLLTIIFYNISVWMLASLFLNYCFFCRSKRNENCPQPVFQKEPLLPFCCICSQSWKATFLFNLKTFFLLKGIQAHSRNLWNVLDKLVFLRHDVSEIQRSEETGLICAGSTKWQNLSVRQRGSICH